MKRILALVNSSQTENDKLYNIVLEQVMCYAQKSEYILVHLRRHDELDKKFVINTTRLSDSLQVVTVDYRLKIPVSILQKIRANLSLINLVRMVTQVIMEDQNIDQIHIHESWPLILLGREIYNVRKKPIFLFEYDKEYNYLSYRKKNKLSVIPYMLVLYSAQSVQKIFAHSPKLIKKVSGNLNLKNKAALVPLAVDTNRYFITKENVSNNQIFIYFSEYCDFDLDSVLSAIKNLNHNTEQYHTHVLVDDPQIYRQYSGHEADYSFYMYSDLDEDTKSDLLKSCSVTLILDNHVQQMQLMNEALCSGSVIVTLDTISVEEDLDQSNSSLISEHDDAALQNALQKALSGNYNRATIAKKAKSKYRYSTVAEILYREIRNY